MSTQNRPQEALIQVSSKAKKALFDTSTVSSVSGESLTLSSVYSTDYRIDNNSFLIKMTVNSDPKSILSYSTVSSNSGESPPFALNPLSDSGIPNNAIFTERAVNSTQQCILPQFTDLVPITVNDLKSDESHKTLNHESHSAQA